MFSRMVRCSKCGHAVRRRDAKRVVRHYRYSRQEVYYYGGECAPGHSYEAYGRYDSHQHLNYYIESFDVAGRPHYVQVGQMACRFCEYEAVKREEALLKDAPLQV